MIRIPMTPEGRVQLEAELKHLKEVVRRQVVRDIEEARAHGDISENAEYDAAKDRQGHVEGRIIGLDTDEGKMTYARLREGAIKGMSIGYRVPAGGSKMGTGRTGEPRRWLKAIDLREVSVVDDPMNPLAKLAYLKSAPALILDARGLEAALRDEHKMSIAEAKSLVAVVRRHLRDAGDDHADASRDDEVEALVASLKRAASILSTKG